MRIFNIHEPSEIRAAAAVILINLILFVLVTSLPSFQAAHHHWIFPVLSILLAGQWIFTWTLDAAFPYLSPRTLRGGILFGLIFFISMGIIRHATILACFDQCGFKLAAAAAIASLIFW